MKMVIFGAGASYDCIYEMFDDNDNSEWRPPLANQLFEPRPNFRAIFDKYVGLDLLLSSLNATDDIEEYFQSQWDFAKENNAVELQKCLIDVQFALQELMFQISSNYKPLGLSNYDIIVNDAYKYAKKFNEDVIFINFNYDLFLEYSLRKIFSADNSNSHTKDVLDINEYIKHPIKLIKLHGSCNWFKKFNPGGVPPNGLSSSNIYRSKIKLEEIEKMLIDQYIVRGTSVDSPIVFDSPAQYYFPQLLIPFRSKDSFILPKEHESYLRNNLEKVDDILVIGWKGYEDAFLNLLKSKLKDKQVNFYSVNCKNLEIENHIKQYLPNSRFEHFIDDFSNPKNSSNSIYKNNSAFIHRNYTDGGFSSFVLRTMKRINQNFFNLKD